MFDHISEKDFLQTAESGDILLFRSKASITKITRAATNSHFDHIAMIVKQEYDDNIYFLQASG